MIPTKQALPQISPAALEMRKRIAAQMMQQQMMQAQARAQAQAQAQAQAMAQQGPDPAQQLQLQQAAEEEVRRKLAMQQSGGM